MNDRHKVFVSYHHENDEVYKDRFEILFSGIFDIMVSRSVQIGDLDPTLATDTIRRRIREEYLRDSTVTVVLNGAETWQRKHVDWEIAASIRHTQFNLRSGLLGILLPTYPTYPNYDRYTIPPRLYDNVHCGFAEVYVWSDNPNHVQSWIHGAFNRRNSVDPDNTYPLFVNNRSGERWYD